MQAVLAIPALCVLRSYPDAEGVLTRKIAGVPLLIRVIATAMRAGTDKLLVIWPPDVDQSIWNRCSASPLLRGLNITAVARPEEVAASLDEHRFWLPWNLVTHKRALPDVVEGVLLRPETTTAEAERFLVAHAGKPTDGMYSRFNRWLCRPAVRLLAHTPVTPNWVTLTGLAIGILAAFMYARGYYAAYVAGALLFFLSGLCDDADGMLARITFRESVFGTWFEGLVDEASYLLLFAGITAGLYRERGPRELTYGCLLLIGCALSILVTRLQRKMATAPDRPHEYAGRMNHLLESDSNLISRVVRHIHIFIRKGVAIHYLVIFTVLGGLPWLLRLAALGANLTWTLTLYFNRRFFRGGKAGSGVTMWRGHLCLPRRNSSRRSSLGRGATKTGESCVTQH
jgi:phosphatidylglycerophosphate synthase